MSILFLSGPVLGHIARLISIAREINKKIGKHIVFGVPEVTKFSALLEAEGFEVRLLSMQGESAPFVQEFPRTVELLIKKISPEVLVIDWNMLLWGGNIIWPEIPRVLVTNVFLTTLQPKETTQQDLIFDRKGEEVNKARKSRGLEAISSAHELYNGDYVCLADPEQVIQQFSDIPSNYLQTGACFVDLHPQLPDQARNLKDVLLISLGSTGRITITNEMILHLKTLSGCQNTVLVGTNHTNLTCLDMVLPSAPLETLIKTSKLVVTHGGAGSTYQALSLGKSVVVYPSHKNHEILGMLVEKLGAGVCVSEDTFYKKLNDANFDIASIKAIRFGQEMQNANGPRPIAHLIHTICNQQDCIIQ